MHLKYMKSIITYVAILCLAINTLSGQDKDIQSLNLYVDYINKSIDGGFIVQRLLENYNKDINKYVDLDSYKLNFYTNDDLPKDIYASEWFFDPTCQELFTDITNDQYYNKNKDIRQSIDQIQQMNEDLNHLRFHVEELIKTLDLTERTNLGKIYKELEKGVELFKRFDVQSQRLKHLIDQEYQKINHTPQYPKLHASLDMIHNAAYGLIRSIRAKDDILIKRKLTAYIADLKKQMPIIQSFTKTNTSKEVQSFITDIIVKAEKIRSYAESTLKRMDIPKENEQYGIYYHHYNYNALSKFNEQGPGMAADMSRLASVLGELILIKQELPYYFKVIYPKKIEKIEIIEPKEVTISAPPKTVENREVVINKKIRTGNLKFIIKVYDHMVEDGDVISLQFNNEWIVKERPLKKKPFELTLELNPDGKNYLLLHAENEGSRPPNTMAVDYDYFGTKKRFILESDMNTSEMIEIVYIK